MNQPDSKPMFVYYYLPSDNDEEEHPNTFSVVQQGKGIKLRDIKARFPLPGSYHWRFKMKWESAFVWMDVTNEDSIVPVFGEKIIAKVLRLNWDGGAQPPPGNTVAASPTAGAQQPQAAPSPPPPPPSVDMLDFGAAPQSQRTAAGQSQDLGIGSLDGAFGTPATSPPATPQRPAGGRSGDDFDMLFS
eukprot:gnl/TRDRNA2_/TRDRNA2_49961_c0_seq1.p2 gnl/TRDRNA2_/TRDRNA2_49961_c0~~gnl/TRDRNA2_/TRDRNA2_49961_c0_seq1.p2  ORF type:complete len:188 (+),score=49.32 gnl/TRDRNA2_/TRDRNA2_49961_c0_seq1:185-748(+)